MQKLHEATHSTMFADKMAAAGLDRCHFRLATAIKDFRDHDNPVEDAMSLVLRIYAGEKVIPAVAVQSHTRRKSVDKSIEDIIQEGTKAIEEEVNAIKTMRRALFGIRFSDGRDVSKVRAHELPSMDRDGALARELMKKLPVLTGEARYAELGDLITKEEADDAKQLADRQSDKTCS